MIGRLVVIAVALIAVAIRKLLTLKGAQVSSGQSSDWKETSIAGGSSPSRGNWLGRPIG